VHTILETIAADTPAEIRPWLALLFVRVSRIIDFDPDVPNLLGRFALALHPDALDCKMRAVLPAVDALYATPGSETEEIIRLWGQLEKVGAADALQAAWDAFPRVMDRLLNAARTPLYQLSIRLK
jgi:hypothetical protein